jgi:hypothetical protein
MKNGSAPKRSTARSAELAPEIKAAACVDIPVEPVDAPMWPIHPAGWLQPEAPATAPSWTGLNIERRHRIPAPDFLHFALAPFPLPGCEAGLASVSQQPACPEAAFPVARPMVPQTDLAPLGWDPRAASPIKESK